ncbi:MAG: hypothetical protein LBU38_00520 [Propionibacteriaceae bacterium]|jgi:hypothetical protein|nr:hypothetical protein [Propionibacteriaceae bacterium]
MSDTKIRTESTSSLKPMVMAVAFILAIGGSGLALLFAKPENILPGERRPPAEPPSMAKLIDGGWDKSFESYLSDRFPGREQLRGIVSFTKLDLFRQSDVDGRYRSDGQVGQFEAVRPDSVRLCAEKIATVAASLPGRRHFYAVIPDKSSYLEDFPGYDPAQVKTIITPLLSELTEVDLTSALSSEDYYTTDLHWNQVKLENVASTLGQSMGFNPARGTEQKLVGSFWGTFAGQLALPMPPDQLFYLTSPVIDQIQTGYLNAQTGSFEPGLLYQLDRFTGPDPYDVFLGGPQPLIRLGNPTVSKKRQLVVFRDSFGSSLTPLLLDSYSEVVLVDLRYINSKLLTRYVQIDADADVLFLYSSQVVNHAETLLVTR